MTALSIFRYEGENVRVIARDGEPWFVVADLCRVLGIGKANDAARGLDDDERGTETIRTPSGDQQMLVCSEPGMFSLILRSRKPEARAFKRWITHDVLPSIRQTGAYEIAPRLPQSYAEALRELATTVEQRDQLATANAELTPRAEAWDDIASAEGDYSVGDAAKMLARAGVPTGPQRLFEQLAELGWIFRGRDGKWRAYADRVDSGHLSERPQSHHHPRTGEVVIDAPQVRVTLRGVERLRVRLGVLTALESA